MDNSMCAYRNLEHENLHPFMGASPAASFLYSHNGHDSFSCRVAGVALPTHQHSHLVQPGYTQSVSALQYLPRSHGNVDPSVPFYGAAEPQMMISRGPDYSIGQAMPHRMDFDIPTPTYSAGTVSPITSSPSLSFMSSPEQCYPYTAWLPAIPSATDFEKMRVSEDDANEDDGPFDRPYAQLIYDALMQAPGHRMLLREIYDWFVDNTKKPRESGTKGWQNSIRHNLSMNQAFENDKNDPAAGRGARKANSVWVLTEHAIQHGVQSTTRYRKKNATKKPAVNKAPAVKRQRSGARGGRATRRAARSKQVDDDQGQSEFMHSQKDMQLDTSTLMDSFDIGITQGRNQWTDYESYSPDTPQADHFFDQTYNLSQNLQYHLSEADIRHEAGPFLDSDAQLCRILSQGSLVDSCENTTRI